MKRMIISIILSSAGFLLVGFGVRCFPLGCVWLDWGELLKVFLYVVVPVFVLSSGLLKLFGRKKQEVGVGKQEG